MRGLVMIVGLFAALGCSSSDKKNTSANDTLNCQWLTGQNCWKTTIDEAATCALPSAQTGVLSADGTTCSYASGQVIRFNMPLTLPLDVATEQQWDFTISNGAQTCLHYVDTPSVTTLTVGNDTANEAQVGYGVVVTCPDGSQVSTSNPFILLTCGLGGLPGNFWSSSDQSVSFGLTGGSSSVSLFSCTKN